MLGVGFRDVYRSWVWGRFRWGLRDESLFFLRHWGLARRRVLGLSLKSLNPKPETVPASSNPEP